MRAKFVSLAVLSMVMATDPVQASIFNFSFTNVLNGGGNVTGVVTLNSTDTAATSVRVLSNTDGFGLGEYVGTPALNMNTFTVVSGQITAALFLDFGSGNSAPAVTCCSLRLELGGGNFTGLTNSPDTLNESSRGGLTFTPFPAVPLPATLPLFATGLGVLGLLGRRRRRKVG